MVQFKLVAKIYSQLLRTYIWLSFAVLPIELVHKILYIIWIFILLSFDAVYSKVLQVMFPLYD